MSEATTKNKMGTQSVAKLMLTMGIPMILSMVVQAFYNIVDSYFVSQMQDTAVISGVGEYAVNALTLSFPIQMLMIAIGVGLGVGINALLSRSLGQGVRKHASRIAGNAIFLGICVYLVFLLIGLFGINAYFSSQTSDPIVMEMGNEYLSICTTLSFGSIIFMIYEKLLQATGRTTLSMIAQLAGAITNIILDPILIFGYIGFPKMGIAGAAYATVIGQILSLLLGIIFHHKFNKDVDTSLKYFKPKWTIIKSIFKIGIPAIIMQALMSFMTYGVNIVFGRVSDAVVTAYGMYYKIQQFVFFAAFGMNNAMIPIISFNYGMADKQRVKNGLKYGMIYTLVIMAIGAIALQIFAQPLIGLFNLSSGTFELCVLAIRIVTLGYLFAGANIAFQGIFQAFGHGMKSLIVSLVRLVIAALPIAYLFTLSSDATHMVWWAFPIAEGLGLLVALFYIKKVNKESISVLNKADIGENLDADKTYA